MLKIQKIKKKGKSNGKSWKDTSQILLSMRIISTGV